MQEKVYIFIPDSLQRNIGFLEGVCITENKSKFFLITSDFVYSKVPKKFIGLCGTAARNTSTSQFNDWIHINIENDEITIGEKLHSEPICIIYDFKSFSITESFHESNEEISNIFEELIVLLKRKQTIRRQSLFLSVLSVVALSFSLVQLVLSKCFYISKYCAVFNNFEKNIKNLYWIVKNLQLEAKFTVQILNVLCFIAFDIAVGYVAMQLLLNNEIFIFLWTKESTNYIVDGLKDVLNTLMGSPGGLKLNEALNRTLAIFFFYHISLWRAFINSIFDVIPKLRCLVVFIGYMGLSFQIALICDLISFLTFHVYCIYVYAARFYGLQISAIGSLWKLFIGRKYNPLRNRVDSFQYTNNQLFVGTLGFTILIFLLPTTFLYYAVFTMFRLWVLLINRLLIRIINVVEAFPVYLILLRIFSSSKLKGKVRLEAIKMQDTSELQLYAFLDFTPLWSLVKQNSSPVLRDHIYPYEKYSLMQYLTSLCTGKLI